MSSKSQSHHGLPALLDDFVEASSPDAINYALGGRARKKAARELLYEVHGGPCKVRRVSVPFSALSYRHHPAVFFTKQGQRPLLVKGGRRFDYSVQLWDGRECVLDRRYMDTQLLPECHVVADRVAAPFVERVRGLVSMTRAVSAERRHVGLGVSGGLMSLALLMLLSLAVYGIFTSTFGSAEIGTLPLVLMGLVAAVLMGMGFLQVRQVFSDRLEILSASARSPDSPYAVRQVAAVPVVQGWLEAVCAPLVLLGCAALVWLAPLSVAAWSVLFGCAIPSAVFLSRINTLASVCDDAFWLFVSGGDETAAQPAPTVSSAIEVSDLSVARDANGGLGSILSRVSFTIGCGEAVGLIGTSSRDIEQILRVVVGLRSCDAGSARINGRRSDRELGRRLAYYSDRSSFVTGSVLENLQIGSGKRQLSSEQIVDVLKLTGLHHRPFFQTLGLDTPIRENGQGLSLNDQFLLRMARALVHRPEIIIAEMPADRAHQPVFRTILESYLAHHKATLVVGGTHGSLLSGLVKRTLYVRDGDVALDGPTDLVLTRVASDIKKELMPS